MTVLIPYCKMMQPTKLLTSMDSGTMAYIMFRVMYARCNCTNSVAF